MLSKVDRTFFEQYILAMVLHTTPWSESSGDTFDVDDGYLFIISVGCCCSSCAFFFSSTIFLAVDLLAPASAAVLYHTRFSDRFIPDFFSSMQNLSTFSIIAPASSLYLHTSLAILHVHNTSKHFFCKHVNLEKISCFFANAKKKIKKKVSLGLEPSTLGSNPQLCFRFFKYNRYT